MSSEGKGKVVSTYEDTFEVECPSCNKVYAKVWYCDKCFKRERRLGAVEELEKLLARLQLGGFKNKEHLWEIIEERLKELEGKK